MTLKEVLQNYFNWTDQQLEAFHDICYAMNCGDAVGNLLSKNFDNEISALKELNPILQQYIFRGGENNPFGAKEERFDISSSPLTERHKRVAKDLKTLGVLRGNEMPEGLKPDAVLILGSTAPSMAKRMQDTVDLVLPHVPDATPIYGLGGERKLIEATKDPQRGYLGDICDDPNAKGFVTSQEASSFTVKTETFAMEYLAKKILHEENFKHYVQIDAKAKPGRSRPDTNDTAVEAAKLMQERGIAIDANTRFVIVTDATFPGQKDQLLTSFIQSGFPLRPEQLVMVSRPFPPSVLESPAYIQIGASSFLAERTFRLLQRCEAEAKLSQAQSPQNAALFFSKENNSLPQGFAAQPGI
jgi:hypothetical protein